MTDELQAQFDRFDHHWRVLLAGDDVQSVSKLVDEGHLEVKRPTGRTPRMYRKKKQF